MRYLTVFLGGIRSWSCSYEKKRDFIVIFGIFAIYIAFYSDVIFYPKLIGGIDFQLPLSIPSYFDIGGWEEINLGQVQLDFFFYNRIFSAALAILSAGDQVLAQKLFFLGIPFGGISFYLLIRNHVTKHRAIAFVSSIVYMFAPYTTQNYGTGLIWEFAFVPLSINYGLFFLSSNQRIIRNLILFNIFYSLSIAFGIHALLGVPITLFIIFLARAATQGGDLKQYIKRIIALTAIGIGVFFIINPGIISVTLSYFDLASSSDTSGAHAIPQVTREDIYINYKTVLPLDFLTMANWLRLSYFPIGGLIIVAIALVGLMKFPKKESRFIIYGFAASYVFFVAYGLMIYFKSWIFEMLFPTLYLLAIFRGTEGIALFIILPIAVLLAHSLTVITKYVQNHRRTMGFKQSAAFILSMILVIQIAYSPVFSPAQHLAAQHYDLTRGLTPVAYPYVYQEIIDWLRAQPEASMYRAVLLPTSFLAILYVGYEYKLMLSPTNGYSNTNSFVQSLQESLIEGSPNWGNEISPASVKYIIVPYVSDEPKLTEDTVRGNPRIWYGLQLLMNGSPKSFVELLDKQSDIKLVYNTSSFAVYENTRAIPRITSFSSPIVLLSNERDFTEWGNWVANTESVPLLYGSKDGVPLDLQDSIYYKSNNLSQDLLEEAEALSGETEGLFYAKIVQEGSSLMVMIPNTNYQDTEYTFNMIVDDENKATNGIKVPGRSVGVAVFDPNSVAIMNGSRVYVADTILNRVSNTIDWKSSLEQTSNAERSFNLQPSVTLIDSKGRMFSKDSETNEPIRFVRQPSSSEYVLDIQSTKPFYVFLGQSYSQNWNAYVGSEKLQHYRPPFGNIFYVDRLGEFKLSIRYENMQQHLILAQVVAFVVLTIVAIFDKITFQRIFPKMAFVYRNLKLKISRDNPRSI